MTHGKLELSVRTKLEEIINITLKSDKKIYAIDDLVINLFYQNYFVLCKIINTKYSTRPFS